MIPPLSTDTLVLGSLSTGIKKGQTDPPDSVLYRAFRYNIVAGGKKLCLQFFILSELFQQQFHSIRDDSAAIHTLKSPESLRHAFSHIRIYKS